MSASWFSPSNWWPWCKAEPEIVLMVDEGKVAEIITQKSALGSTEDYVKPNVDTLFELNKHHLKEDVVELTDVLKVGKDCSKLMDILKDTDISKEELSQWQTWSGQLSSKGALSTPLQTVVEYVRGKTKKAHGTVEKLEFVTAKLLEKEYRDARSGILILLAAHGGVCNVQKEVGITMAYASLTNSLKLELERQSMKPTVLRLCRDFRAQIVEQMFKKSGQHMNTHPLTGYRNGLAPTIGLHEIPDEHTSTQHADEIRIEEFFGNYSPEAIVKMISRAMNDKPRKISYKTSLNAFQDICPPNLDHYEFLEQIFGVEGNFLDISVIFLLWKLDIFKLKKGFESFNFPKITKPEPEPLPAVDPEKTETELKADRPDHDDDVDGSTTSLSPETVESDQVDKNCVTVSLAQNKKKPKRSRKARRRRRNSKKKVRTPSNSTVDMSDLGGRSDSAQLNCVKENFYSEYCVIS